jgi:uncharacterized membrane protein YbhN (UPF0104 family)
MPGLIFRGLVALGLLGVVVWANRDQIRMVLERPFRPGIFVLALAFYLGGVGLAFTRWYALVRAVGLPFRYRDAWRLGFIGLLFNLVIPGAVGGDVVKAAFLCREQGRRTEPIATIVLDRLLGLIGLFGLAFGMGLAWWSRLDTPVRDLVVTAGIATAVATTLLVVAFLPLDRLRPHHMPAWRAKLALVGRAYRSRPGVVAGSIVASVAVHVLNVSAFWLVTRAMFPDGPGLAEHFLIVPLVLFSTAIPLPLGALGASEAISGGLFRLANHQGGAVVMMGFRLLQVVGASIGLGVYLANLSAVRRLQAEAAVLEEEGMEPSDFGPSPTIADSAEASRIR